LHLAPAVGGNVGFYLTITGSSRFDTLLREEAG
jgi:hypothetical protein